MLLRYCLCSRLCSSQTSRCFQNKVSRSRRQLRQPTSRAVMSGAMRKTFFLDEFAEKQFNNTKPDYSGTRIHFDTADFTAKVQQYHNDGNKLIDGYAPFCKHIFVPNFTGAKLGSLGINQQNKHLLQTGYSRRRPEELPVLSRHVSV